MRSSSNAPQGVISKLFTTLFFLVFLSAGLFFVWQITRDTIARIRVWGWQKTNCEITASEVRETEVPRRRVGKFGFEVEYRYRFDGRSFSAHGYKRDPKPFSDYGQAARLAERYKTGTSTSCYVNPAAPEEAVLERDSLLSVLAIFFPMIFVAIGAGGIYFTWRPKPALEERMRPISDRANWGKSRWAISAFFLIFLLVGSGIFYGLFLRPISRILAARDWPAVPCIVLSSEVETHQGEDGNTYSVNILYRYEVNGREFKANRYSFMGASSSGFSGKQAIVNQHPTGRKTLCYVNPNDSTDAVLERGFTPEMWFGLLPLLFVAVGAGGLIFTFRKGRQGMAKSGRGSNLGQGLSSTGLDPGMAETKVLKPRLAPWAKLLGILVMALFWNGILSIFVVEAAKGWRSGRPDWFLTLFLVPFVAIGLGFIFGIFYFLLALFNPRPRLQITPGAVPLGGLLRVEWDISGRCEALQGLRLRLQGREEAKYRRGTNTSIDRNLFADMEIAQTTNPHEMRSGTITVRIPASLMHSFASANNQILWLIRVEGSIARWPDVEEEFPVTVLPAEHTKAKT